MPNAEGAVKNMFKWVNGHTCTEVETVDLITKEESALSFCVTARNGQ